MVDFSASPDRIELLADFLWSMGVVAIEERNTDSPLIVLRTSMGEEPSQAIAAVTSSFPDVSATIVGVHRSVADTWREHATATWVDDVIALVPAWLDAPIGSQPIFIEPFDTFGLGNHPTTVLALRLALQFIPNDSYVIDLGCGSGVLAISLSRLKNCGACVFDIADSARGAVEANAVLNNAENLRWIDNWKDERADAVMANILAPVLKAESKSIQHAVTSGGTIILSGMRDEQVDDVLTYFAQCSELLRETGDGWTAVALRKE